ncbi:PREDICTED: leukocyte elastase inhibitor-like isoform X2 [Dinoponera quadriceps]|uniref:Leukocyte elastase inhibitor-like isoform X2 n=1 Tax=Dinoponera quadriceps TaxID=609295 RepID=A0A6P3Y2K2_DINQU|nr:PREDICTED: leukocyte elastase inhibitor-like isoform X2 [Dinoponera quadriceps]
MAARLWLLLFGLLALGRCQKIIYPDQYEIMKASNPPYAFTNDGRDLIGNKQSVQNDQQFKPQFAAAAYPSTTITTPIPALQPLPQDWSTHVNNIIARGLTKFSLDLDRAIYNVRGSSAASHRENTIFSPLSISVALSMVLLGSAGNTFSEVSRVLGLEAGVDISQHSEVVHQMFGLLLNIVNYRVEGGNGPRVSSASGIFVQDGYPIRPEFRAISQNAYKSEVINLDFRKRGAEAMNVINNWVKERTNGKISSILSQQPDPLTTVILASALYFNGEWNQHFIDSATKKKPFFIEPNESVEVDMMYNGGPFPFYEDRSIGVKMLQLPYKGMEMSMYVLLPKAEGAAALKRFSDQLTTDVIEHLINNLKNESTIIGLPRMKLSSTLTLKNALRTLGLQSLFDPSSADLSILSNGYGSQPAPAVVARPYVIPQAVRPYMNSQATQTSSVTARPYTIPQAVPQPIPQTYPQALSQNASRALPENSQTLSQVLSQALPQALPQVASQPTLNSVSNNDFLIFSRFGQDGNQDAGNGIRRSYIRIRRDTDGRDASRLAYVTKENLANEPQRREPSTKYVSLEENKYRFRDADERRRADRKKRQTARPMDESFLRFIQSRNFQTYGLDELRNNAQLTNPGLFADEVLHKVEMEVTERGTEAAAATAVLLERDGNQKRLIANRPFLFFIRHDPTGLILFWGTVNTPTPNYTAAR